MLACLHYHAIFAEEADFSPCLTLTLSLSFSLSLQRAKEKNRKKKKKKKRGRGLTSSGRRTIIHSATFGLGALVRGSDVPAFHVDKSLISTGTWSRNSPWWKLDQLEKLILLVCRLRVYGIVLLERCLTAVPISQFVPKNDF